MYEIVDAHAQIFLGEQWHYGVFVRYKAGNHTIVTCETPFYADGMIGTNMVLLATLGDGLEYRSHVTILGLTRRTITSGTVCQIICIEEDPPDIDQAADDLRNVLKD